MPSERQPSAKTSKKNRAYQHDRAKQRRHDVVVHAQRNFRHKGGRPVTRICNGAASHPSLPSHEIHLPAHQTLAFKCADGRLVRHHQENSHRAIWRCEWLFLFNHVLSAKGLSAGVISPSGSNESSNSGRGEPASIC